MILITSAKYLADEFQSEFGKIVPSFLPLGGKRLYEYQAGLFSNSMPKNANCKATHKFAHSNENTTNTTRKNPHAKQNIVLSLPQSFVISDFEKAKINNLGISVLFIPDNLSLGESIAYCLNMNLPLNEPLQILHGDTYFTDFTPFSNNAKNALGISKALYGYEYAKLDLHKFTLKDKIPNAQDFVLNGYFCIANPHHFLKALLLARYDFINALKIYSQDFAFVALRNDNWLDFGLISSYFHGKSVIFTKRHFNSISIDSQGSFITKSSHQAQKIKAEIQWFESLPKELQIFVPKIYPSHPHSKISYKCEYLYLSTLAEIFVFGRLNGYAYKIIFEKLAEFLGKIHAIKPTKLPRLAKNKSRKTRQSQSFFSNDGFICHTEGNARSISTKINKEIFRFAQYDKITDAQKSIITPNFNYTQKSAERLSTFAKERDFNLNKPFRFNGKIAPSLNALLDKLARFISVNFAPCFIHGDFCFSNICFDFRSLRLKTFDPRGLDFSGDLSVYGDKRYDYAKLAHCILGLYDFIVFGFYECEFSESSEYYEVRFRIETNENLQEIQQIFLESALFKTCKNSEILAIMCHLFLSMLPLHSDDKSRQNALLANAYRIYFEFLCDKATNHRTKKAKQ